MKILFVTETWGPETGPYETHFPDMRRIAEGWGHTVCALDNKANYLRLGGRTVWTLKRFWRGLGWVHLNNLIVNRLVISRARLACPDLVLFTKGENIRWRTLRRLRQETGAVLVNWSHDNPFWPSNTSMDLLRSIPFLDCFCTMGQHFIPALLACGAPHARYLPMFFNERRFADALETQPAGDSHLRSDVLFIGRGTPERADMLRHLVDTDLAVYGDWDLLAADDPLRAKVRGRYLGGHDYALAMRSTRIALNVLVTQCKGAHNLRTFEATGCGAFLLTEYSREQGEVLFREGEEIACFHSPEELRDKVHYYLEQDRERAAMAAAGEQRCRAEHLLEHRLRDLIDLVQEIQGERPTNRGRTA